MNLRLHSKNSKWSEALLKKLSGTRSDVAILKQTSLLCKSGQGMQAQGGLFNTMQQQAGISVGITIEGNKLHIKCEMLYKYTFFHTECHSIYVKLT